MARRLKTEYCGKNLRDTDLRGSDFTDQSMFGADLSGASLYGAKISLRCATFDGLKLDDVQVSTLLLLLCMTDSSPEWRSNLRLLITARIGKEKLRVLDRYLQAIE